MNDPDELEEAREEGLLDGREIGEASTRYKVWENVQIYAEASVLVVFILGALAIFANILIELTDVIDQARVDDSNLADSVKRAPVIHVAALYLSGFLGGCIFSLKWLYHAVANGLWNRDRFLWRICVPLIGGVLGIFVTFVTARAFGPTFDAETLATIDFYVRCGFAFLVGIFADGVVAFLERLARRIFGTLEAEAG